MILNAGMRAKYSQKKEKVFDELRKSMSIALPTSPDGLNDNGEDVEMNTIENRVKNFTELVLSEKYYRENKDYQKMINQIEKYWDKLFINPIIIIISPNDDISFVQPHRTNNIMEQFFRSFKRAYRRTAGNNSMCKKLQSMFADTPLIKNLENTQYMKIILNGKDSLAEQFAKINHEKFTGVVLFDFICAFKEDADCMEYLVFYKMGRWLPM